MSDLKRFSPKPTSAEKEPEPCGRTDKPATETREENRNGDRAPAGPAGNPATGTLKLIALFFMLMDHLGAVVFVDVPELRIVGRIAFPIYCWCLIVGFHYTRSVPKYMGRMLLTGLISQPLYAWVMNHMGNSGNLFPDLMTVKPNIFLTLLIGLAGLWGIRENRMGSRFWAPAAAIALATVLKADYGWKGVLFILLLYACRNSRIAIASVMIAFFLFWGASYSMTSSLFGMPLDLNRLPNWLYQPLSSFLRLETYGLISLAFVLPRFRKNVRMPVWVSYAIYPAHLLIVLLFKTVVQ